MNIPFKSLDLLQFRKMRQLLELITKCPKICVKHSNLCAYSSCKMTTAMRLKHVSRTSSFSSLADSSPRLKTVQRKESLSFSNNTKSRNEPTCVPNKIKYIVKSNHSLFRNYTLDSSPYCNLLSGQSFIARSSQYRYFHRPTNCENTSKEKCQSQSNKNTTNKDDFDKKVEDVDIAKQFVEKQSKNSQNNSEEQSKKSQNNSEKLSIMQRFKKTYKEHGLVLVVVHCVIGWPFWYGLCFSVAYCGLDVVPYLEYCNFPDSWVDPFRSGHLGTVAVMFLLMKLLSPIRYSSTVYGTRLVIKYMHKSGRFKPVAKEDSLRSLASESSVKIKESSVRMKSRSAVQYNKANKNVKTSISRAKTGISDFNHKYRNRKRGKQNRD